MIGKILGELNWFKRVVLAKAGVKRRYRIGNAYITLDFTHRLPDYQFSHPYYDRFLPHLVSYLPSHSVVIDVGANVGDTLVGMIGANSEIEYICIEADSSFFADLQKNVRDIQSQFPNSSVHAVNVFVGKNINDISLEGVGGTKHAVLGGGSIKSQTLNKILDDIGVKSDISLIKTDVDGFDYDVIRSAYDSLQSNPYLYFECQYENVSQLNGYKQLFSELIERGYEYFSVFDNFGQFIVSTSDLKQLEELLDYVYRQNTAKGSRTFFYYDILAYSKHQSESVKELVSDYLVS